MVRKLVVLVALVVLGLFLGLVVYSQRVSWLESRRVEPRPAASVPEPDLDLEVSAAATAISRGEHFTLVVGEGEVNERLAATPPTPQLVRTPLGEVEVRDPRVRFDPGEATLDARAFVGALELPLTVRMGVELDSQGHAQVRVRAVELSGIALPISVADEVQAFAQTELDRSLQQVPARLERIEIESGRLVIIGSA